jgi:hypothetical protein
MRHRNLLRLGRCNATPHLVGVAIARPFGTSGPESDGGLTRVETDSATYLNYCLVIADILRFLNLTKW